MDGRPQMEPLFLGFFGGGDHFSELPSVSELTICFGGVRTALAGRNVEEVCERYDVDGVELDFFRHPFLFKRQGWGEPIRKEELEINLVPLIDVMMVILIFLMVTTTYSKYTELQINAIAG